MKLIVKIICTPVRHDTKMFTHFVDNIQMAVDMATGVARTGKFALVGGLSEEERKMGAMLKMCAALGVKKKVAIAGNFTSVDKLHPNDADVVFDLLQKRDTSRPYKVDADDIVVIAFPFVDGKKGCLKKGDNQHRSEEYITQELKKTMELTGLSEDEICEGAHHFYGTAIQARAEDRLECDPAIMMGILQSITKIIKDRGIEKEYTEKYPKYLESMEAFKDFLPKLVISWSKP